jgi:hypothetical protein
VAHPPASVSASTRPQRDRSSPSGTLSVAHPSAASVPQSAHSPRPGRPHRHGPFREVRTSVAYRPTASVPPLRRQTSTRRTSARRSLSHCESIWAHRPAAPMPRCVGSPRPGGQRGDESSLARKLSVAHHPAASVPLRVHRFHPCGPIRHRSAAPSSARRQPAAARPPRQGRDALAARVRTRCSATVPPPFEEAHLSVVHLPAASVALRAGSPRPAGGAATVPFALGRYPWRIIPPRRCL